MKHLKILFWILIALILFFTRFYKLTAYPQGLTIDEVSIGYNAFSILKTGRDEWGTLLPVSFRSVGDFKAPLLIYLTVPFVRFLGLNELSVRLPVALASVINVYLFWLLVSRYIFTKKHQHLAYLSTFIFSLSPWVIIYSRSGFEAILAQTFMLANVLFAFRFLRTGKLSDFLGQFFFAYLSAIAYHSTKIVVPLLNLALIIYQPKFYLSSFSEWRRKNKTGLLLTALFFAAITIFFLKNFVFGPGASRAKMTFLAQDFDYARILLPVFTSQPLAWLTAKIGLLSFWFKRLLEYFSPNFYLSSGLGLATFGQPGQGVIYAIEYPFLFVGFLALIFRRQLFNSQQISRTISFFLTIWFFLSLLPASITNNSQHSLRTLNIVPVVAILIAVGFYAAFVFIRQNFRWLFLGLVTVGYLYGLLRFADYYTLHYPVELSETRSYGWKEMALYGRDHHQEYDHVYVDHRFGTQGPYNYGIPYMYFLFYSQYDPAKFMTDPRRETFNADFENYIFAVLNWPDVDHTEHNLYIASPWSLPKEVIGSSQEKYYVPCLNGTSGLYAVSD